ncbi:MAG: helix-turn-helix domain-containing protein [Candidatus Magasanikbacteria bacterium]
MNGADSDLVEEVWKIGKKRGWSKKKTAQEVGINPETFYGYFKQNGSKLPSDGIAQKMREFLKNTSDNFEDVDDVLREARKYMRSRRITKAEFARRLEVPRSTLSPWLREDDSTTPSRENLLKLKKFLDNEKQDKVDIKQEISSDDLKGKAKKIKYLIFLLEKEVSFFLEGSLAQRKFLRKELDFAKTEFLNGLLRSLADEEAFQRWKEFNL